MKDANWKRFIAVQVSPNRSVIAEPSFQDWQYKACTKPISHGEAWKICREMNEVEIQNWSQTTRDVYKG